MRCQLPGHFASGRIGYEKVGTKEWRGPLEMKSKVPRMWVTVEYCLHLIGGLLKFTKPELEQLYGE